MRPRYVALVAAAALLAAAGFATTALTGSTASSEPEVVPAAIAVPPARSAPPVLPDRLAPQPPPDPETRVAPLLVDEPPATVAAADGLGARLAALLADPALTGAGAVAVSVLDGSGNPVFEHAAHTPLVPASTQKLVVAAAALAALGPDFRYTTTLYATAPPGPDGVIAGDLVLVGSGDPVLATPLFGADVWPERPRTPLESLADQLAADGVTHVTGGVLGDPSFFPHQPLPQGWLPSYLTELNGTYSSGLTVDGGRKMFWRNGRLVGEPAVDPAAEAAASLYTLLTGSGVAVGGGVGSTTTPPPSAVPVASVDSPPLRDLLRHMVQRSDNHLADAVFRTIGAAGGDATWAGSAATVQAVLAPLGLDWTGSVLADGSGLSRDDRLSAGLLTRLDAAMSRSSAAAEWEDVMAVTGQSGTLRRRLLGSVADGQMRGKTGTLRDVRTLSGAVLGPDGSRYYFAVVGNGLQGELRQSVRALQDEVVLALAEELRGCVRVPLPPPEPDEPTAEPDQPAPEPGYELVCAA